MKFTEHPFRTVATIGFFAGLAKSNLVYTLLKSVSSPVLPPAPFQHHLTYFPTSPPSASTCPPHQIPTVQPSSGNLILSDHRQVESDLPRGSGGNLARIHSHPSLANAGVRSGRRLVPPDSAGCVCERLGRLPHGGLGVSKAVVCELFRRLAKSHPALSLSLHSYVSVHVHPPGTQ